MTNVGRIDIGPPHVDPRAVGWNYTAIVDIWLDYTHAFTAGDRVPDDEIRCGVIRVDQVSFHDPTHYADIYTDVYLDVPRYDDVYVDTY